MLTPSTEQPAWGALDPSYRERLARALDSTASGGGVLVQRFISRLIGDLTNRELGVHNTLEHRPGQGDAAYQNRRTAGTTGGSWVADGTDPTEETGTYAQTTFTYRRGVTRMQISSMLQARGKSYGDAAAIEAGLKVPDFVNFLENAWVRGDNAADANQPSGLVTLIQGTAAQIIPNTTAAAGDSLVLRRLDEAIDAVRGPNSRKVIFASRAGKRRINAALQAQQQFVNTTEIRGGFRVMTYDDIPVVTSTQISDAATAAATTGRVLTQTGGSITYILVCSMDEVWIEDLTPISVLPLARTTVTNERWDIFTDSVLVLNSTNGASILSPITA